LNDWNVFTICCHETSSASGRCYHAAADFPENLGKLTGDAQGSIEGTVSGKIADIAATANTKLNVEDANGKQISLYWIFNFINSGYGMIVVPEEKSSSMRSTPTTASVSMTTVAHTNVADLANKPPAC
jgi:hypothetical protein